MPRILVIDDDEVDRELAARCLAEIEELEIAYAEHGEEGLQSIAERIPDLVLTDLRMPGMDGLELVEKVRSEYPLLPIVLMTSKGNELIAVKALRAGASVRRQYFNYKLDDDMQTFKVLQNTFTTEAISGADKGFDTAEPVFILGLPRTGSTLIERIISSHSKVFSAGELNDFSKAMMEEIRKAGE